MKMMSKPAFGMIVIAGAVVVACASGPKFVDVQSTLPTLASDMGRIFFYRSPSLFGSGIQPAVLLNGEKVGTSVPGGVFLVDVAPGTFEVSMPSNVEQKATIAIES